MQTLQTGQKSRHAGAPGSRDQSIGESEAALSFAITIVHWIVGGFITGR